MKLPGRTIGPTLEQQLAAPYLAVRTAYCQAVATAVRTQCYAPGARLVVSHWPSCHTRTRTEPAEADHDEHVGLCRSDRNATARQHAGPREGAERWRSRPQSTARPRPRTPPL